MLINNSVAIIIPVYNSYKYLKDCIESVISQTYKNLEIILVDDGSTDNSLSIIKKYAKLDKRIKFCSIKNSGVSNARNTGIKMATSNKIIFIDSDDVVMKNLVEILIKETENSDFVMCGYEVDDIINKTQYKYLCPQFKGNIKEFCDQIIDFLIPPYLLGPCFKLFDKKIIEKWNILFPTDISFGEDAEFVLMYLEHAKSIKCISYIGYIYKKYSSETLSQSFIKNKMDIYNRINNHILKLLDDNKSNKCIATIHNRYIQNYVEYSKELIISKLKYKEKRELFLISGELNNVLYYEKKSGTLSFGQKIIIFSLKKKMFWPTYIIFTLKKKIINKVII